MKFPQQSETARQNGAQSTGPVTPESKAKSSRNAIKHGLNAKSFILQNADEKREFDALEAGLIETYIAVTPAQKRQARQMVIAMWRQTIVTNMEMALIAAIENGEATANEGGAALPSLNSVLRYRARVERDLKQARDTLAQLQEARMKMFQHKIRKAKEFKELSELNTLRDELGLDGFTALAKDCINEPNASADDDLNREQRRRLETISRKKPKTI